VTTCRPHWRRCVALGLRAVDADVYSAESYYARATSLVQRVGAPVARWGVAAADLATIVRAVVRIGILSRGGRHFWRLVGQGLRRGTAGVRRAITHAVMAEHSLRYTSEHVLPRIEHALAEAHAAERRCAGTTRERALGPVQLHVIGV
jgi:Domain of unknown function (DUF4070)